MPLPIAHSATGLTIFFLIPKEYRQNLSRNKSKLLLLGTIALANTPDLDFIPGLLVGQPNLFHHNASHSIFSTLTIATTFWLIGRTYFTECSRRIVFLVIWAATLSHLLLDYFSSDSSYPYGIPLLWPFSEIYFIASFPLFRDVSRFGGSNAVFFQTLLNENNFWEIILELFFLLFAICLFYITKGKNRIIRLFSVVSALLSSLSYYALQIEPNWIEVNNYDIDKSSVQREYTIAQVSDLHLKHISYRENTLRQILSEDIKPDLLLFSGDTFDPFGENQKTELSNHTKIMAEYITSLPGEKFLVWGEGITNNRHQLNKFLSANGVTVLEDTTALTKTSSELTVTGKLPELADFHLTKRQNNTFLTADGTELNSFLHYDSKDSYQWQDYDFSGEFVFGQGSGGMGLTFYSQYTPHSDRFYRIRWSGKNPRPIVSPHGAGELSGKLTSGTTLQFNQNYFFKIWIQTEEKNTKVQARFWLKNSIEPTGWNIQATDSSPQRLSNGTVGVWVNGEAGGKLFDNFKITSIKNPHTIFHQDDFENRSKFSQEWQTESYFTENIFPIETGNLNILLAHSPEIINSHKIENFDIILTGDTHGGQVRWPWGNPIIKDKNLPPEWYSGLHTFSNQKLYINKGIGTSRLPIRLFCRPEIAIFKLH